MPNRFLGALIILGSLGLAGFGLWSFAQARTMVDVLPLAAPEVDPQNWALHWRMHSTVLCATGLFGVGAGVGLVLLKRWSFAVLAGASATWITLQIGAAQFGYSRYPFEALDPIEIVVVAVFSLGALLAYRHESRPGTNA